MSYDESWNISSHTHTVDWGISIFIPVNGILDLVFEPDGKQERIVRGGRRGVAGQLHSPPHQAGHSHQAGGGGGGVPHHRQGQAGPGQSQHSQHQHSQHQPAGILSVISE